VLTVEVSSFQLGNDRTFHPSISLWLNFAPDHLDRYRSVSEYRAPSCASLKIKRTPIVAVVNAIEKIPNIHARTITFSAYANAETSESQRERFFTATNQCCDCGYEAARLA